MHRCRITLWMCVHTLMTISTEFDRATEEVRCDLTASYIWMILTGIVSKWTTNCTLWRCLDHQKLGWIRFANGQSDFRYFYSIELYLLVYVHTRRCQVVSRYRHVDPYEPSEGFGKIEGHVRRSWQILGRRFPCQLQRLMLQSLLRLSEQNKQNQAQTQSFLIDKSIYLDVYGWKM